MATSTTTTITNTTVIINTSNTLSLNGDYIVSTNATLEINDIANITLNGNKIILDGTSSSILFLGTSTEVEAFISNIDVTNGANKTSQILTDKLPCLLGETKVKTILGYKRVKYLTKSDILITHNERKVPIVEIYKSEIKTTPDNSPYIIPSHYFSRNYPKKPFKISPLHAISTNKKALEWCIPNIHCRDLKRMAFGEKITYYHIELPNWYTDHIVIEGETVVESFGKTFHGDLNSVFYIRSAKTGYFKRDEQKYKELMRQKIKKKLLNKDIKFK